MNGPSNGQTGSPPTGPTSAPRQPSLPADLLGAAAATLADHSDNNGFCQGCHQHYGQLKPYPCEQARWAAAVLDQPPTTNETGPAKPR